MRTSLFSRTILVLFTSLALGLAVQSLPRPRAEANNQRVPMVHDWSMRHAVYSHFGPLNAMLAAQKDPRAWSSWRRRQPLPIRWPGPEPLPPPRFPRPRSTGPALERDWSINLGAAGTAANMYPAKFSFDVNATPSCANDFVVFPIAAAGSATQPNLVAFNNLYSGTAGSTGICNRTTPPAGDNGTAATTFWSYNVSAIGGAVTTSPALSFDPITGPGNSGLTGLKVAFVESAAGQPAHFHVLAWKSGDGLNASNLQSVGLGEIVAAAVAAGGTGYRVGDTGTIGGAGTGATYRVATASGAPTRAVLTFTITSAGTGYVVANPVSTTHTTGTGSGFTVNITSVRALKTINTFSGTDPEAGSGTATDLPLGSSSGGTDTLSSPYIDYVYDKAYVGNDIGQLYRIKDVFCTAVNPDCSGSTKPAPSIDATWGSGGYVAVCTGKLTGPVLDYTTMNVFVGCSVGKLYSISQSGTVNSLQVGNGTTYGGIVDPPIVDGVNGFVYAVSGTGSASGGANGVLVQAKTDLSSSVAVPIGNGNQCNMHAPSPNNPYYTGPTTTGALMYVAGVTGTVSQPCTASSTGGNMVFYGVTFNAAGVMNSGTPVNSHQVAGGIAGHEWAPLLEFYNPTTPKDWLFTGFLNNVTATVAVWDITAGFPASTNIYVQEGLGTSGMIVDNDSSSAQASSIYFNALRENAACTNTTDTTQTGGCAVKLTQAALQ